MTNSKLTQETLHRMFLFVGGVFTRLIKTSPKTRIGEIAGSTRNKDGYGRIKILGKDYLAHRVAWLYVHGVWPEMELDHINGNKSDNRIENLREVTRSENLQNLRKPLSTNLLGVLGVSANRKGFQATIGLNKERIALGTFATPELAGAAYLEAKRKHHVTCTI